MKKFLKSTPVVIVSVSKSNISDKRNTQRTTEAARYLEDHDIPSLSAIGKCDGFLEHVFVIPHEFAQHARILAEAYDQDAILYVDGERVASLGTRDAEYHERDNVIGMFNEVPFWQADNEDYYTLIDGRYFVVED